MRVASFQSKEFVATIQRYIRLAEIMNNSEESYDGICPSSHIFVIYESFYAPLI